jgi:uncharacterized protein
VVHKVFVDTVAWLALLNVSDGLHTRARQVMRDLRQQSAQLMTTEFVLLEMADALSGPSLRGHTVTFFNGLRRLAVLHIFPLPRLACLRTVGRFTASVLTRNGA